MKTFTVKEVFYTLQGEGVRAGTPAVFVRFGLCNMDCQMEAGPRSPGKFVCDTNFQGGEKLSAAKLLTIMAMVLPDGIAPQPSDAGPRPWCVLTGGEPMLQVNELLVDMLKRAGWCVAMETNGTIAVPRNVDWICVSPKVHGVTLAQRQANEAKYVIRNGDPIPDLREIYAPHHLLSPAHDGNELDRSALAHCIGLVKTNPEWRLSLQNHKVWGVR